MKCLKLHFYNPLLYFTIIWYESTFKIYSIFQMDIYFQLVVSQITYPFGLVANIMAVNNSGYVMFLIIYSMNINEIINLLLVSRTFRHELRMSRS